MGSSIAYKVRSSVEPIRARMHMKTWQSLPFIHLQNEVQRILRLQALIAPNKIQ